MVSSRTEAFSHISLPVHAHRSLTHALSVLTSCEVIGDANKVHCSHCMCECEMGRSCKLLSLPPVLFVHLNIFVGRGFKLQDRLAIPLQLRIRDEWCSQKCASVDCLYELKGVVVHYGETPARGHYATYTQDRLRCSGMENTTNCSKVDENDDDIVWLYCDDASVTTLSTRQLFDHLNVQKMGSHSPYILLFELRPEPF
jgi:ubiquitin C-terminal hydrolase